MRAVIQRVMGMPDGRTPPEVDRDIDDEFAFHIEMIEAELLAAGKSPEDAAAVARARFGEEGKYRAACRAIALKERTMLARINVVLLVLLTIGLGVTAWQSWQSQNRTADAVEKLGVKIEAMNTQQSSVRDGATAGEAGGNVGGTVTVTGDVARSGVFNLPAAGLSVRRLLVSAGWDGKTEVDVTVERANAEGSKVETLNIDAAKIADVQLRDEPLRAGDLVWVKKAAKLQAATGAADVPKTDEFGRIATLQFGSRVLGTIDKVRAECFAEYDAVCEAAGLTALRARSETILVVGDVDRPGVYVLDAVTSRGPKATLLDVMLAAGARPTLKTWHVRYRVADASRESTRPSSSLYGMSEQVKAGFIVIASDQLPSDDTRVRQSPELVTIVEGGAIVPVESIFSEQASDEVERLAKFERSVSLFVLATRLQTLKAFPQSATAALLDPTFCTAEKLAGVIDWRSEHGGSLQPIMLRMATRIGKQLEPIKLAALLAFLPPNDGRVANLTHSGLYVIPQVQYENLRVRVYDRLALQSVPVADLPWSEAMISNLVIPDGALVVLGDPSASK